MSQGPQKPPGKAPQKNRESRRPDKPHSSNLMWYVIVFAVISVVLFAVAGRSGTGEQLKYSEFVEKVEQGDLNAENVFELKVGLAEMVYQDQSEDAIKAGTAETVNQYTVKMLGISDPQRQELGALLKDKGIHFTGGELPSEWGPVLSMLFVTGLFVLVVVFLIRRIGGAGSAMSFGRSRGRLYAQEDIEVTFNDVAGIEEAKEELCEIVEFLRTPQKYQALGGRIPRGVLLVGPPGTGKTLLAKAVAGEAGVPFFGLSGSDFVEMYVGVGAARVRDMFQQAIQRSPAIIFIDELDALGKVRGSGMPGGHDEREQTLNALLVEMDGFSTDHSIIVMGATNRPETLDPALMRPGRFDRHVLVDRPDIRGREEVLKVHAKKVKLSENVDLRRIAKLTPGFVGADLANLVNEAALLSARREENRVTMKSFEDGIERVMAGLEKTSRIIAEDVKKRVACHESGHALVACNLPNTDPVHKISIIPRGMGALGYMLQLPEDERELLTQSELEARICVLLGGIAAEQVTFDETSTGAQNDLQRATDIARRMVTEFGMSPKLGRMFYSESQRSPFLDGSRTGASEASHSADTLREIDVEVKGIVDRAYETAREILDTQRETLDHIATDLVERETMSAEELQAIIDEHRSGPQLKPGTSVERVITDDETPDAADDSLRDAATDG